MKLILMLFEKHAVELLLPALAAAVLILIVFFLFSNVREWKSLKQSRAAPRHGKSDESSNAGDKKWLSSSVSIPRFLLLGPSDSGKTALLDGLRHVSSRDRTWITDLASGVACWHLAGGEVLEIAGTLFPSGRNGNGAEKRWKDFLTHLHQQRPQRPLDGIILTLPSSHLCGDNALPAEDLQHQATQMAKQLKLLRDQLGFCFPLYLVITKCDAIPGYTTFVRAQLTPHLGEMFGWSTPYDQDAPFDPAWTAQAFADVNRALSSERVRFFTERGGNGPADDFAWMDDLFLFPARLSELQGGVSVYLEKLLENSGHRDALLFRGIYFTGSARYINEAFDESRSGNHAANRVGFTSDLFNNKIFAERSLAHPVETALTHSNASVSFYRALCIASAVLLLPGAFFGWYSLSKASPEIIPHLERIHGSLSQGKSKLSSESAYSAIYAAQGLSGNNFQSIFLPASILDSLGPQVADIMTPVFNQIVYPGLRMDLERRTSDLLRLTRHEESGNQTNAAPQPATGGNTAQSFSSFTDAFLSLEDNIVLYNGMSQTGRGNGKEMMALASSLSPGTFTSLRSRSTSGLNDIVRDSAGTPFDGGPWNKAAANKLEATVTDVLRQSMNEEQLLGSLDTLVSKINLLEKNKLDTYAQLNGLLQSLGQVQTYLAAPDLQWIARNEDRVQLPDDLKRSLDRIFSRPTAKNVLLCDVRHEQDTCDNLQEVKATIEQIGREHFVNMRKLLLDASTTTTGPLVATTDTKLQLSQPAVNLQTVLNNFLKLPFVAHEGTARLRDIESGQQLFWDNDRLQAAVQDKQAYDQFFGSQLANTSENL
ncbi:MAG TPA: type VI secretion protein IcmF/TssM N-terminal domain-containing protein, partial [Candidatus Sulfotelmatobacter sp.]|nr:type VI secretion protein IcmF/TssM N-terminal domain-containing protein [Candidatus Sulfotelmatobacter sp.]